MANWISHLMIVDKLFAMGVDLDERGFAVGSIAPDCNVENEDWTEYTPSKEITHWMHGESKLTADYEGFYQEYIKDTVFLSGEHKAFLWGYYAHLVTDVAYQKFVRDEKRVKSIFRRLKQNQEMHARIGGLPEDFDTLKKVFGRNRLFNDVVIQEINYLRETPGSRYNTVIKQTHDFPDYIDYLPQGTIVRKIGIMAREDMSMKETGAYVFFTQGEFNEFAENTSELIYALMNERHYMAS